MAKPPCVGCGQRGIHRHHVVYVQHLRQFGGSARDKRNLVSVCKPCHDAHHAATSRLPIRVLPDSVFEFALELMGPGAAYELLRRYYDGDDPRLDVLLAAAA